MSTTFGRVNRSQNPRSVIYQRALKTLGYLNGGGGGVGRFRTLKTRNLLKMRDAQNARTAQIALNWNVSGTRTFQPAAPFFDNISLLSPNRFNDLDGLCNKFLAEGRVPARTPAVAYPASAFQIVRPSSPFSEECYSGMWNLSHFNLKNGKLRLRYSALGKPRGTARECSGSLSFWLDSLT